MGESFRDLLVRIAAFNPSDNYRSKFTMSAGIVGLANIVTTSDNVVEEMPFFVEGISDALVKVSHDPQQYDKLKQNALTIVAQNPRTNSFMLDYFLEVLRGTNAYEDNMRRFGTLLIREARSRPYLSSHQDRRYVEDLELLQRTLSIQKKLMGLR